MVTEQDRLEAHRKHVAGALSTYLQLRTKVQPAQIQRYSDKIRSGQHDDFYNSIAITLQAETNDLFAEEDSSQSVSRQAEIMTFLAMQDEDDRLEAVPSRKGQPRSKKEVQEVIAQFEQQMPTKGTQQFITLIDEPYPPCTASLDELEVITLSQLAGETVHRGRKLVVKRTGSLDVGAILTKGVVADEHGDAEHVELYHAGSEVETILPVDVPFVIKEPFFYTRRCGTTAIRVDHPSNLIHPRSLQKVFPDAYDQQTTKTAQEWKDAGNGFFSKKQYFEAGEAYKAALDAGAQGKLKLDTHRNLARVDLTLARYEQAKENAIMAISDGGDPALVDLDGKAYFRAGCACYHLRDFEKAEEYFEKLLALCPADAEGRLELTRAQQRLAERKSGCYDLEGILQKLSRQRPRIDVAGFRKGVEIGESKGKGRGLFAAEDIQLGEIILCDKAFCTTMEWEDKANTVKAYNPRRRLFDGFPAALWTKTVQSLVKEPSWVDEITSLCGTYAEAKLQEIGTASRRLVDTFQIHEILTENAFAIPTPSKTQKTQAFGVMKVFVPAGHAIPKVPDNCAIYGHASLVNHSCLPNATRVFVGDVMVIRATRPIAKGQEIFQTYATYSDIHEKQSRMMAIWHFQCDCALCQAEIKESDDHRKRRAALSDEAEKLANEIIVNLPKSQHWREGSRRAEKLVADLKTAYDAQIYKGLPLHSISLLQTGLAHVYLLRQEYTRCKAVIVDAFACLGWTLSLDKVKDPGSSSLLQPKADHASRLSEDMVALLAVAYRMVLATKKDRKVAGRVRELAEKVYVTLNGVVNGIEMIDKEFGKGGK